MYAIDLSQYCAIAGGEGAACSTNGGGTTTCHGDFAIGFRNGTVIFTGTDGSAVVVYPDGSHSALPPV